MLGFFDWIMAIVAIICCLYLYGTWNHDYFKRRKFPFAASPRPLFGNFRPNLFKNFALPDLLTNMYEESKGYKVFGFFEFTNPAIMVKDPEIIKMVTVKEFDHFADRVVAIGEDVDSLFGRSLLSLEGQRWKDMRATLSPAFTSSKMKAMFGLVSESGKQLADHLEKRCKGEKNTPLESDMKDLFSRYANDVIATSAFGVRCDSLDEPENAFYVTGKESVTFSKRQTMRFLAHKISPTVAKFLGIQFIPEKSKAFFRSLVVDTMRVREREGIIRPDMIHLLMEAKKGTLSHEGADEADNQSESHKTGKKFTTELSDEDITAQALLFFFAGFDTTSTHLCFFAHLMAEHPDIQRRVQEEIDAILEADDGKLTYEGVQNAKYLDMCVSEALRLWPPAVASNRQCVKPYVLPATENTPSFKLKKGDGIWIPIMAIHRDPQYFPDPHRFHPERFNDDNKRNIHPYTYMPFGSGPRNCIGMRFAQMEVKIALIHLLSRFNLEVSPKTPKELKFTPTINVNVEGGFWLGISPRN